MIRLTGQEIFAFFVSLKSVRYSIFNYILKLAIILFVGFVALNGCILVSLLLYVIFLIAKTGDNH